MRFSIIVPVYNAAQYLPDCLASLLGQKDAPDYEIFCIDDGSTDESAALLDAAAKAHPDRLTVLHTKNQGSILARREGILRAKGEYLLFADADDWMEPDCLKTVDARLTESDADILLYNYAAFADGEIPTVQKPLYADGCIFEGEGKRPLYERLLAGWSLNNLWNKAVRASLMREDATDFFAFADNPLGDDLLLLLEPMTRANRIVYLDRVLYRYRSVSGSLTHSFNETRYSRICDLKLMAHLATYPKIWGFSDGAWETTFAKRLLAARIDGCMSFYRHAADGTAKRAVLARDWLKGLPMDSATMRQAIRTLPKKQHLQYFCIRNKQGWILDLLLAINGLKNKRRNV